MTGPWVVLADNYKTLPSDVTDPLNQMLRWALWLVLLVCAVYLINAAGKLMFARGDEDSLADAGIEVMWKLVAAVMATGSTAIALAILS